MVLIIVLIEAAYTFHADWLKQDFGHFATCSDMDMRWWVVMYEVVGIGVNHTIERVFAW